MKPEGFNVGDLEMLPLSETAGYSSEKSKACISMSYSVISILLDISIKFIKPTVENHVSVSFRHLSAISHDGQALRRPQSSHGPSL